MEIFNENTKPEVDWYLNHRGCYKAKREVSYSLDKFEPQVIIKEYPPINPLNNKEKQLLNKYTKGLNV